MTLYYGNADVLYAWSNEPLREYYDVNMNDKKVLSVTSSGDHILHAAFAGSYDITGFDINRFCKYYSALKIAMIKKYNFEDFIEIFETTSFCYHSHFYKKIRLILNDVSKYLSDDEISFWSKFIELQNEYYEISLFPNFFDGCSFYNNVYCTLDSYKKLKDNLQNCRITYIDCNASNLYNKISEKYDLIYLSNILGKVPWTRMQQIISLINSLKDILNINGKIYDYAFFNNDWHYIDNKFNLHEDELLDYDIKFRKIINTNDGIIYTYNRKS